MSEFDRLLEEQEQINIEIKNALNQYVAISNEMDRFANVAYHAGDIISSLDKDFEQATKLNGTDISFLFLAVALQCARQYLLSNNTLRLEDKIVDGKVKMTSSQRGDQMMKSGYDKAVDLFKPTNLEKVNAWKKKKKDWKDILFQSVPYDATDTLDTFGENIGLAGTTHRYRTLGHDPFLGWFFGVANIMTSSLTKTNFQTYIVQSKKIAGYYPLGTSKMFNDAIMLAGIDPMLLAASIARQAIHFGTDYFTKQGLPLPLIATVDNKLAQKMLTEWHIDAWSFTKGAGMASFINLIIALIHRLFFTGTTEAEARLYDVRTRKILSHSNVIASTSNVLYVALTQNFEKLDAGGIAVTLYRLITDYKFIQQIKNEFIEKEWYNIVMGDEPNFIKGENEMSKKDHMELAERIAKPLGEKVDQLAKQSRDSIKNIEATQDKQGKIMVEVIKDQRASYNEKTYGLKENFGIEDLKQTEKKMLIAVLYTLADKTDDITDQQRTYIRSVQNLLRIRNPQVLIDLSCVANVKDTDSSKAMLQTVLEFFYLGTHHPEKYTDEERNLIDCFNVSIKTRNEILEIITSVAKAVDYDGLAEKYGFVPEEPQDNYTGTVLPVSEEIADMIGITEGRSYRIVNPDFVETDNFILYPTGESREPLTILEKQTGRSEIYAMGYGFYATKCSYGDVVLFEQENTSECCVLNLRTKQIYSLDLKGRGMVEFSWLTERFVTYINDDFNLYICDIENNECWPLEGVFNERIRWIGSEPIICDEKIYYLEEVDDKECRYLCAYDPISKTADPVCMQRFPVFDNRIIGNICGNKNLYIISQDSDVFSDDYTLRIYQFIIDSSTITEIASFKQEEYHSISVPEMKWSSVALFTHDSDADETMLYLLDPINKTVDPIAIGIRNSEVAVLGAYIYYNKDESVYRICLDTMEVSKKS